MEDNLQDQFLIALHEFLGVAPHSQDRFRIFISEKWHIDEHIYKLFRGDRFCLSHEIFNELMVHCGRPLASSDFYDYFFGNIDSVENFKKSVDDFRIAAMLLYGNFLFAYKKLATSPTETFKTEISKIEPINESEYSNRTDFKEIMPIPKDDLHSLGYLSRKESEDLATALMSIKEISDDPHKKKSCLGQSRIERIESLLKEQNLSSPFQAKFNNFDELIKNLNDRVIELTKKQEKAAKIGEQNTLRYLTLSKLDVYLATSMRDKQDYIKQHHFTKHIINHDNIKPLKLRYFDPTLSYLDERIKKGLVEGLMLKRAKVTIYNAGKKDSLGKDSELAATLAQGKPVIVYVPEGNEFDSRAELFKEYHPLGLQIDMNTGVAKGVIVVRNEDQCALLLKKVLLQELEYSIKHENGNYILVEKETGSVLRIVTDDPLLTHSFWTFFLESEY